MNELQSIVLGIVQGLGEFLPISSSAHLILVPYLLMWQEHSIEFDVALHLGTLLAVVVFFWSDIVRLVKAGLFSRTKSQDKTLFWHLIAASIPAGIIGVAFEKAIDEKLHSAILAIGILLGVAGVVLWYIDKIAAKKRSIESITLKDSLLIGLSQVLALMPGVSRSGATMSTGLLLGLTREAAARFSFLMSIPIIAGAGLLKLRDLHSNDINLPFVLGVVVAAVVGYISIRWLLNYLKHGSYAVFAWYRLVIAVLVIATYLARR